MGIPHLGVQIRPYAQHVTWSKQKTASLLSKQIDSDALVIDGPSFAYYVYHQCLSTRHNARNALEAIPTYQELGDAAIVWLETVESFRLRVKNIFFDGFLPTSKTDTRYERLAKSLLLLKAFRSSYTPVASKSHGVLTARASSVANTSNSSSRGVPSRLTAIPAAPFLVPAILDALFTSKYKGLVQVVPCEAEIHCTNRKLLFGNEIILTNDSDLILLAGANRVMFFNDIDISEASLHGLYYETADISAKLSCPDLIKLGYCLKRDPFGTLKELAKLASQATIGSPEEQVEYKHFAVSFCHENQYSAFAWAIKLNSPLGNTLSQLDPRVSEFTQQWGTAFEPDTVPLQSRPIVDSDVQDQSRVMFLPFLIDDPSRASAWRPGAGVRRLAYSILLSQSPPVEQMQEVDRRGDRVVGTAMPLITDPSAITAACKVLLDTLPQDGAPDAWKMFALFQVLAVTREEGSNLPAKQDVLHAFTPGARLWEWAHVHLSAQVEAYLYSLRLLSQLLKVYLAAGLSDGRVEVSVLETLSERLGQLPRLAAVMGRAGGGFVLGVTGKGELEEGLREYYVELGREEGVDKRERKRRRKMEREDKGKRKEAVGSASVNMFSLLEDV